MRILITQRDLRNRGGSEMVTVEVAIELRKRGHEVAVFCPRVGELAIPMTANGVWVRSQLREIPWAPDVIHGQHHLQAMAAIARFSAAPGIYYCHGVFPWVEKPPAHPRFRRYVMICEYMVARMGPEYGISPERVTVIPNFVDTARFSRVREPAVRPKRAVLFGNTRFRDGEKSRLEAACAREGISLEFIGMNYGNPQPRPEIFLPEFDLVFATGKCAMEALACGCAVIPVIPGQAGHLITVENFAQWAFSNFSPRYFTSADQIDSRWLHQELLGYSAAGVAAATEKLRAEHHAKGAVDQLIGLYEKVIQENAAHPESNGASELAQYLEAMNVEVDEMWVDSCEVVNIRQRMSRLEHELNMLRQPLWKRVATRLGNGIAGAGRIEGVRRMLRRFAPKVREM